MSNLKDKYVCQHVKTIPWLQPDYNRCLNCNIIFLVPLAEQFALPAVWKNIPKIEGKSNE